MARTQQPEVIAWLVICFAIGSGVARPGPNGKQTCGPPPTIEHAHPKREFNTDSHSTGTTISYQCQIGYATHGDTRVHCVDFGSDVQWTKPRFSCHPILCEPPQRPDNGQLIGTDHSFGQTITYSCDQGYDMFSSDEEYLLTDSPERICKADGTWTLEIPLCKPVTCTALQRPDHGSVHVNSLIYMSKATYHCAVGYQRIGDEERRCLETGEWSGSTPKCEEIKEPEISTPKYYRPTIESNFATRKPENEKSWLKRQWEGFTSLLRKLCFWC